MFTSIIQQIPSVLSPTWPIVAPVFLCVFAGFVWKKLNRPYDTGFVSQLVMNIGAPALIISSLSMTPITPFQLTNMLVICATLIAGLLISSVIALKILRYSVRDFIVSLTFPNVGNMGLPLCLFAFGEKGLSFALALFMIFSLLHFSLGVAILSGRSVLKQTLTNPIIYSVIAAAAMVFGDFHLPYWASKSVKLLGDFTIPMMLLTLGVSLATLKVEYVRKSVLLAVLRLGLGLAVGWGVCEAFDLEGVMRGVVILQATMPVAVFNYMFAMQYNRQPQVIAGMVVISTLLSFITLPWLLSWLVEI